jgi:transcriptional regulator with XRE-family HTH domain
MENETMNDRLRKLRNRLGISQKEMSESLIVRQSYFSDIENSRRTLTNKFIAKLQKEYNVSKDWLYTGLGNMLTTDTSISKDNSEDEDFKITSEIEVVDKQRFESELSNEDKELLKALTELPGYSKMLYRFFKAQDSIRQIELLSSIGADYSPMTEIRFNELKKMYKGKRDIDNEHYELYKKNMLNYFRIITKYKKTIIDFRKKLITFLGEMQKIDQNKIIWIPKDE